MVVEGSCVSIEGRRDAYLETALANADGEQRVGLSDRSSEAGSGQESSSSEESGLHCDGVDWIDWSRW
jgi:hypothetical protein